MSEAEVMFECALRRFGLGGSSVAVSDVQRVRLEIAYRSGNAEFEKALLDMHLVRRVNVSKFSPGEHYYALDRKFDDLKSAKRHIERECCIFGELVIRHTYPRSGD